MRAGAIPGVPQHSFADQRAGASLVADEPRPEAGADSGNGSQAPVPDALQATRDLTSR